MQSCFFAVSGVLPRDEAIAQIKKVIAKTYARKGDEVVKRNYAAVDHTLSHLRRSRFLERSRPLAPCRRWSQRHARFRPAGHCGADGRQGRLAARVGFPRRRHLACRHDPWEKRTIADEVPAVGCQGLHPVQQVRHGLSSCGHPGQGLRLAVSPGIAQRPSWPLTTGQQTSRAGSIPFR